MDPRDPAASVRAGAVGAAATTGTGDALAAGGGALTVVADSRVCAGWIGDGFGAAKGFGVAAGPAADGAAVAISDFPAV